jgi:hypothetical protein
VKCHNFGEPTRFMAYDSFRPHRRQPRAARKKTYPVLENTLTSIFFCTHANESGASSPVPPMIVSCTTVQSRCTSLQNFAICETAGSLKSPPARLGCRFVCTTSGFAQKKDASPVGGRGISGFFYVFSSSQAFWKNYRLPIIWSLHTRRR